jgi:hypothetical protein
MIGSDLTTPCDRIVASEGTINASSIDKCDNDDDISSDPGSNVCIGGLNGISDDDGGDDGGDDDDDDDYKIHDGYGTNESYDANYDYHCNDTNEIEESLEEQTGQKKYVLSNLEKFIYFFWKYYL